MAGREAFQEIDYRQMFGPMAKWVAQIDDAARIPELISRAFQVATSGRPGPVVLALPEDMLVDEVEVADAVAVRPGAGSPGRRRPRARARAAAVGASGRSRSSAARRGRTRRIATSARGARRAASPSPRRGGARTTSTTRSPVYVGHVGLGPDPRLAAARARGRRAARRSEPGSERSRPRATRC